jgi:predicted amidohydrolase YtcJ
MSDFLVRCARVWSGAEPAPTASWIAVRDGRIEAIGGSEDRAPEAAQVIVEPRAHVLPSFVDCHTHLSTSAWMPVAGDASVWSSRDDALAAVERAAATAPENDWLLFMNMDYSLWPGRKPPSAGELEAASGGRPVFLVDISLHRAIVSETALRRCNITSATLGASGDITFSRRGTPTGELWEGAFARALRAALEEIARGIGVEGVEALLVAECERHLAYGITDAHDPCVPASIRPAMSRLAGETPLRVSWSIVSGHGILEPPELEDIADDYGAGPASAKFFMDGAHRCSMCLGPREAMRMTRGALGLALRRMNLDPIRDLLATRSAFSGGELCTDFSRFEQPALERRLEQFRERGLRLKIHALGNMAARDAARVLGTLGGPCPTTFEHLLFMRDAEIEAVAGTGATGSIQPGFLPHYGASFLDRGMARAMLAVPARSLLEAGMALSISSDNPCGPLDPLVNVRAAVERTAGDGRAVCAGEALTQGQALRAATIDGMTGISGAPKRGLEAGAPADFVVCSGDPFEHSSTVRSTWIGGRRVYSA